MGGVLTPNTAPFNLWEKGGSGYNQHLVSFLRGGGVLVISYILRESFFTTKNILRVIGGESPGYLQQFKGLFY